MTRDISQERRWGCLPTKRGPEEAAEEREEDSDWQEGKCEEEGIQTYQQPKQHQLHVRTCTHTHTHTYTYTHTRAHTRYKSMKSGLLYYMSMYIHVIIMPKLYFMIRSVFRVLRSRVEYCQNIKRIQRFCCILHTTSKESAKSSGVAPTFMYFYVSTCIFHSLVIAFQSVHKRIVCFLLKIMCI